MQFPTNKNLTLKTMRRIEDMAQAGCSVTHIGYCVNLPNKEVVDICKRNEITINEDKR